MKRQRPNRLDASYTDFIRAVLYTYAAYDEIGKQPGATHWEVESMGRSADMVRDVVAKWSELTRQEPGAFPFRDDHVRLRWAEFRRMKDQFKDANCQEFCNMRWAKYVAKQASAE